MFSFFVGLLAGFFSAMGLRRLKQGKFLFLFTKTRIRKTMKAFSSSLEFPEKRKKGKEFLISGKYYSHPCEISFTSGEGQLGLFLAGNFKRDIEVIYSREQKDNTYIHQYLLTGDRMFDRLYLCKARDQDDLFLLLNRHTRDILVRLTREEPALTALSVTTDGIKINLDPSLVSKGLLKDLIVKMDYLMNLFSEEFELSARILSNIQSDTVSLYRQKCLTLGQERLGGDRFWQDSLHNLLQNDDLILCRQIMDLLGPEGVRYLKNLFNGWWGFNRLHRNSLENLFALYKEYVSEDMAPVLYRFYKYEGVSSTRILILKELLKDSPPNLGDFLLPFLGERNRKLKLMIIDALGFRGKREHILPLWELSREAFGEVGEHAALAVLRIRERLDLKDSGSLEIVEMTSSGALSIMDSEGNLRISE